ncbi:MAG: hypothetical protein AAF941_06885 [Pseudomonadota bacterium]
MITSARFVSAIFVTGLATALPATAYAQNTDEAGLYISIKGGVTSPSDEDFDGVQAPEGVSPGTAGAPAVVDLEYDEDFTFAGTIGYRFDKRIFGIFQPSIEAEYSYASPDISGGSFNGGDQTFAGEVDINTFTINYRSDIRWSETQRIVPYTSGGIGIAEVDAKVSYFPNNGVATAPTFALAGEDTGLVLHSTLGLSFQLTDRVDLETSVRYQRITNIDLERRFIAGGANDFNADLGGRYETVSGFAGVRFRF